MNKRRKKIITVRLLNWFAKYGRKFPWRRTKNPYRIFIAESLLQKTNVEKVYPAYLSIIKKYPNIDELAKAKIRDLRKIIAPLGLVKRAKFLKKGAREVVVRFNRKFPKDKRELKRIIGVGDYVAHAILCFGYEERLPLVDTNVARVYERIYDFKCSKLPYADRGLWEFSESLLPQKKFKEYNLALLDLSALLCLPKKPLCYKCPCANYCFFFVQGMQNPPKSSSQD